MFSCFLIGVGALMGLTRAHEDWRRTSALYLKKSFTKSLLNVWNIGCSNKNDDIIDSFTSFWPNPVTKNSIITSLTMINSWPDIESFCLKFHPC